MPMHWTFIAGELMVLCDTCMDIFGDVDLGTQVAGSANHEGREAVMPDGRPIRSIERIVQDAHSIAVCEV